MLFATLTSTFKRSHRASGKDGCLRFPERVTVHWLMCNTTVNAEILSSS